MLLLFISLCVHADDYSDFYTRLSGTWYEQESNCPTKIIFELPNTVSVINTNTTASGTYAIGKATVMHETSPCRELTCYEMTFNITSTVFENGCAEEWSKGSAMFMNFRWKSENMVIFAHDTQFFRANGM